jgi:hypothetical protein
LLLISSSSPLELSLSSSTSTASLGMSTMTRNQWTVVDFRSLLASSSWNVTYVWCIGMTTASLINNLFFVPQLLRLSAPLQTQWVLAEWNSRCTTYSTCNFP